MDELLFKASNVHFKLALSADEMEFSLIPKI